MEDKDVYAAWSRRAHTPPPPEDKRWENATIWTVRGRKISSYFAGSFGITFLKI